MAVNPQQAMGINQGQALGATQLMPPPTQAGPPPEAPLMPGQAPPVDPAAAAMGIGPPPPPEKKPPTLIPTDIARLLAEAMNDVKMGAAKNLVEWVGDPRGTVTTRDADLLRVWRKRNPLVDPLYEKFVNKLSDEEIMYMMYPTRRALIRYGRRTYTEQVEFAERMAKLDQDPRFDFMNDETEGDEDDEDEGYEPPKAEFPSSGDYMVEAMVDEEE